MVIENSIPAELLSALSEMTDSEIVSARAVSGGCINSAAVVQVESGCSTFLKWNVGVGAEFFQAEAYGLRELAAAKIFRVPAVLGVGETESFAFLFLETLDPGDRSDSSEQECGRLLAELHGNTIDRFGLATDNYIGASHQLNGWSHDWGEFFWKKRLCYQIKLGRKKGWLSPSEESNFNRIEAPVTDFLNESKPSPSLLHGDLWGGNVFWAHDGPALIDPAVYYGDSEADIAFTEMFGGFGSSFYAAYTEIRPLSQQYQQKKLVYNLYHLLNHANLFGGSYVSSSKGQMSSIIEMFNAG